MSRRQKEHWVVEHIWRALRAGILMIGLLLWISQDGWQYLDFIIIFLAFAAHMLEQFHGKICNWISELLHYEKDFNDYD